MKSWYRVELLTDDRAIELICRNLRRKAEALLRNAHGEVQGNSRRAQLHSKAQNKRRYASLYAAKLAIGSGGTEGACGLMQQRVKRRGQSWEPPGLRSILTGGALVLRTAGAPRRTST